MIRLLVAEDEPAAMRYITSLVDSHCDGAEIVAQAEDGFEAKEALENLPVDILITDIQMPHMNGIELAQWVCDNKPGVSTLIVSGYSEFEYAKGAIKAGVAEYLLKPFTPAVFADAMKKLCNQVNKSRRLERERWLKRAVADIAGNDDFPGFDRQDKIQLGILIRGAATGRFHPPDNDFAYPRDIPGLLAATYINDESEICFALRPDGGTDWETQAKLLSDGAPYHTAFITTTTLDEGCSILPGMLQAAKRTVVPGKTQIVEYTGVLPSEPEPMSEERNLIRQLNYYVANSQIEKIKAGLVELFALWESEEYRLISAETTLTRLIQSMADNAPPGHGLSQRDIAEDIPLLCRESTDYPDMLGKTWKFCGGLYQSLERQSESGQLINNIEIYIREHLGEPLSAQGICSVFGISTSNLHRIFRKHVKMSLVEYVTELRIEEAKRMMSAHPDMSIKDIAGHLGFSDQFYFSRVFRALTGESPSEYKMQTENKIAP